MAPYTRSASVVSTSMGSTGRSFEESDPCENKIPSPHCERLSTDARLTSANEGDSVQPSDAQAAGFGENLSAGAIVPAAQASVASCPRQCRRSASTRSRDGRITFRSHCAHRLPALHWAVSHLPVGPSSRQFP
jgi:hypothetical protein